MYSAIYDLLATTFELRGHSAIFEFYTIYYLRTTRRVKLLLVFYYYDLLATLFCYSAIIFISASAALNSTIFYS